MKHEISLTVNGELHTVSVEPRVTLLHLLRNELDLTGTKEGCGTGECGACSVILDGRVVDSCLVLALEANGREVTTIEGLGSGFGQLDPLQKAFVEGGAVQCGYCTPGMIITAKALLNENPHPSRSEVERAIAGNLCRCTGYARIVDVILAVADSAAV